MDKQLIIAQYKSFSDHRIHFSRLYFGVVAFVLIVGAALFFLSIILGDGGRITAALFLAEALFIIFGGFISHKLMLREEEYAKLLSQIEENNEALMRSKKPSRLGARSLVVWSLYLIGATMIIIAILVWLNARN
ncbi:MAG: hypothetical protein AAB680_02090 [Pseudomonadota bacterium]